MINQIQAAFSSIIANKPSAPATDEKRDQPPVDKIVRAAGERASFSTLANQLNESAARAAKRDAAMTHDELRKYGGSRINEFLIESPKSNSATRAMEVPKTNDPELLDRARKASEFVTRTMAGDKHAKSPFEKLSREQLNLVAYDDSGAFTLNERRAAWQGVQKLDDAWRRIAIPEGIIEQTRTGKALKFYQEALSYFKSLPDIEKAVSYPKNAEAILEANITSDPMLPFLSGTSIRQAVDRKLTLYDILAGVVDTKKDKVEPNLQVQTRKSGPRTSPEPVTWIERLANKGVPLIRETRPKEDATEPQSITMKSN